MESVTFDLRAMAKEFDKIQLLPGRLMVLFAIALGVFLIGAGLGLGLTLYPTVGLASVAVLLGLGFVIVMVGGVYYPRAIRAAVELHVGEQGPRLLRMDGRWFDIRWDDYRNEIEIADERALPPERVVPSLRSIEFVFNAVNLPVQGPIPRQAVLAIIASAQSSGLNAEGWSDAPNSAPGEVVIRIARRKVDA